MNEAGSDMTGRPGIASGEPAPSLLPRRAWRRALTPNVLLLGLVSFFADVSSEMLYPLVPLFLTATLGAPATAVGIIEGFAEGTAAILKTVSGRIADRTGRRVEQIFGGYLLSAVAKPLIALAHTWPLVLVARVLDRTGKGFRTSPRDALLADSAEPELRGTAFGWHRAMDTAGAVVGPLLALGLLAALSNHLRAVIALAVIPGLIGAFLVLAVSDPRRRGGRRLPFSGPRTQERRRGLAGCVTPCQNGVGDRAGLGAGGGSKGEPAPGLGWKALPRAFKVYLAVWLPFVFTNSSDVFLILRAKQLGFSLVGVVLVYVLYNAVSALGSLPFGGFSDRWGRRPAIAGGMLVFALVYVGFALAKSGWQVVLLFGIYGLYMAATEGVSRAYALDFVPVRLRATAVGLLGTLTGLAALVASVVAGVLWDAVGPWAPFVLGAAGASLSAALVGFLPGLSPRGCEPRGTHGG